MKRNRLTILALLGGILLALPWLENFSGIILLIAFIPLLFVEDFLYINRKHNRPYLVLIYSFVAFLLWNVVSTFWIGKISLPGASIVIIFNAFLLSMVFFLFHLTKRNLGRKFGNFSLLVYWTGWEYFFMNAEITWPWLNLGNGFAKDVALIQWYEFTGVLGGTLWVLGVNLVLFNILKFYIVHKSFRFQLGQILFFLILVFLPIVVSIIAFNRYETKGEPLRAAVLQPDIDPYEEKFSGLTHHQQINILMNLADSIARPETDYVIGPETAVDSIDLNKLEQEEMVNRINSFVQNYPDVHFIIGVDATKRYGSDEDIPATAQLVKETGQYYDIFNSAIQIDSSGHIPIYHKSKLVSGVETMPYPGFLKFLDDFILNIGGTSGSRGVQKEREVFSSYDSTFQVAPVICYESVFGEYVTKYIHKGANVIFIITNDGWLLNPGYKQHMHFSRLRAIETRRSIARSANTGISCFINQKGQILKSTEWWKKDAIEDTIYANNEKTFYVKHGDLIGRVSGFMAVFGLLYLAAKMLMKSTKNRDLLKLRE